MPFIPHTDQDRQKMLKAIGCGHIADLFLEIPADLPRADVSSLPPGLNERDMTAYMQAVADQLTPLDCFIGAGAYAHFIPAAVWQLVGRGEFLTAYTPYQPEASQGSLQLIYEFQSMVTELLAMEVSNASLYDGATALVEAVMMAVRVGRSRKKTILIPQSLHPHYRQVLDTFSQRQGITLHELAHDAQTGQLSLAALQRAVSDRQDIAAIVLAQPNFLGCLEQVDQWVDAAHELDIAVIGLVNPMAMAWLKPPGQWGQRGADFVCGDLQPLGIPVSLGGPYAGFLCCRQAQVRQLPGRLVGRTSDLNGRPGYTLTLQAREQHIRRAKAKSNICTNQGLLVAAATIYMSLLGGQGLQEVAQRSHQNAQQLRRRCGQIEGVHVVHASPFLHEFVLQLPICENKVIEKMEQAGIAAGYLLSACAFADLYPRCLLVCATDLTTAAQIDRYIECLTDIVAQS